MIRNIAKNISEALEKSAKNAGIVEPRIVLEHPDDVSHGDFSTNVAMVHAKELDVSPKSLAEKIVDDFKKDSPKDVLSVEVAGPGFINIKLSDEYFAHEALSILDKCADYGKMQSDKGKQVMVEYTDPNPFKVFHIGHLMANAIGESISRLVEFSGADVLRACYQGDVGLHVAKTIWAVLKDGSFGSEKNVEYLGKMYVVGNEKYETDESAKVEIIEINKKIFDRSDEEINKIYDEGRRLSLEYFDTIYERLGTRFDDFFFESEMSKVGLEIVKEFLKKGVFEESDGAVVFPGEKYGEHTRVFVNSTGLPTYEAKELGLTQTKFEKYPDLSESVVVTANEQDAYFRVLLATLKQIYPDMAEKTKHISHGILRPATGKMSSRKGNVVSAETLLVDLEKLVEEKMKDREFDDIEKEKVKQSVAIAGLKYTILRQSIGGDIVYDPEKVLSFEGDSGPYLQYSCVRANAVLKKAQEARISLKAEKTPEVVDFLERLLVRFPEVVERARVEYSPHYVATYLIELAGAFNSYYANNKIIDEKDRLSPYRVALTKSFAQVMKNGLWVLGIEVPERM